MKLLYELPKAYELLIRGKCNQDEIKFCLPYDLSEGGSFAEGFLAVTEKKVFVLFEGELVKTVELSENMEFKAQELVASGMLTVTVGGETYRLCSYSMEYLARYAYVARALCDLCGRGRTLVESNDVGEHKCPKCGRLFVHGTKFCPHCADKLGIMKRVAGLAKKEYKLYLLWH